MILSMRGVLIASLLLFLSCGDDSNAPRGNPDARSDGSGGSGGLGGSGGVGGSGGSAGSGGAGGAAGISGDGGADAMVVPQCGTPCLSLDPNSVCVDPDGPGPMTAFCGCANDTFCRNTGHCEMTGANSGRCRCGNGLPCVQGLTICVGGQCMNIDAGTP